MDVGAHVWVLDPTADEIWLPAQILTLPRDQDSSKPPVITIQLCDISSSSSHEAEKTTREISLVVNAKGECTNVLLQNLSEEQDQANLISLPHLHEASILHSLRLRYQQDIIYTHIGEILISINPFKKLTDLYGESVMQNFATQVSFTPHLFAVAKAAFVDVERNGRNQSILISGESGAGKTEATKIMMNYFAVTCGAAATSTSSSSPRTSESSTTSIETQVLQSNPILEAFGNARTVRNDNSSRFGKFIELQFDKTQHLIVGARIRTYLLEKIRVIKQSPNERNFHIFYELLSLSQTIGITDGDQEEQIIQHLKTRQQSWELQDAQHYRLLNQSGCFTRRDGVHDATQFRRTCLAMQQIGLSPVEITSVLEIVAAMLHMGNITFLEVQSTANDNIPEAQILGTGFDGNNNEDITVSHFEKAAQLLGVSTHQLEHALTRRYLQTSSELLVVTTDARQAENTLNALVMECYRLLFEWLVGKINSKIHHADQMHRETDFIGLLDIFGFEDMAVNSFEQLCINYANEALQHQFNQYVFEEEQKLYQDEEIHWEFVDFPNNVACLELFERKPIGIFSLADQECLFPQGTDLALVSKFYAEFDKKMSHPHFQCAAAAQRRTHFVVVHYAGKVTYAIEGFLAKNKDSFCESAAKLLANSSNPFMQNLAKANSQEIADFAGNAMDFAHGSTPPRGGGRRRAKSTIAAISVGTQFKIQLSELLDTIRSTTPHYVRCIKPNDNNTCDNFRCSRVVEQLRSGGVLEAVRVARAGFPVRMSHQQFLDRYQHVLLSKFGMQQPGSRAISSSSSVNPLERCLKNLIHYLLPDAVDMNSSQMQVQCGVSLGKTRVFFRRQPYERLETIRSEVRHLAATVLQKYARGYVYRQWFLRLRYAALTLQAHYRGQRDRSYALWLRQTIKATILQAKIRQFSARTKYRRFHFSVRCCQKNFRRRQATRVVQALREMRAATRIMTAWRCAAAYKKYRRLLSAILTLQCAQRMRMAKKELFVLRMESKNVEKLTQDNIQLKDELAALRQQLQAMQKLMNANMTVELEPQNSFHTLEFDLKSNQSQIDDESTDPTTDNGNPNAADGIVGHLSPEKLSYTPKSSKENEGDEIEAVATPVIVTATPVSWKVRQSVTTRRFSLPDKTTELPTDAVLTPHSIDRRHSLTLWEAQQKHYNNELQQLRDELKATAMAATSAHQQELVMQKMIKSQIRAKTMQLELEAYRDPNQPLDFTSNQRDDSDDDISLIPDEESLTRRRRRTSLTLEDLGGQSSQVKKPHRFAAPMTVSGRYSRPPAWGTVRSVSMRESGGLLAFDGEEDEYSRKSFTHSSSVGMYRQRFSSSASSSFGGGGFSISTGPDKMMGSIARWTKDAICQECHCKFNFFVRRHHCRNCGHSFCFEHSTRKLHLPGQGYTEPQRVCDSCFELFLADEEYRLTMTSSPSGLSVRSFMATQSFMA